ncbi:MAG: hypothetical protein LBR53_10625 [Deltaproteobacteria bacterium]|jgi:hypothetical protein|nr:hypothetical protein [Deltaproteobacteria bacterium]
MDNLTGNTPAVKGFIPTNGNLELSPLTTAGYNLFSVELHEPLLIEAAEREKLSSPFFARLPDGGLCYLYRSPFEDDLKELGYKDKEFKNYKGDLLLKFRNDYLYNLPLEGLPARKVRPKDVPAFSPEELLSALFKAANVRAEGEPDLKDEQPFKIAIGNSFPSYEEALSIRERVPEHRPGQVTFISKKHLSAEQWDKYKAYYEKNGLWEATYTMHALQLFWDDYKLHPERFPGFTEDDIWKIYNKDYTEADIWNICGNVYLEEAKKRQEEEVFVIYGGIPAELPLTTGEINDIKTAETSYHKEVSFKLDKVINELRRRRDKLAVVSTGNVSKEAPVLSSDSLGFRRKLCQSGDVPDGEPAEPDSALALTPAAFAPTAFAPADPTGNPPSSPPVSSFPPLSAFFDTDVPREMLPPEQEPASAPPCSLDSLENRRRGERLEDGELSPPPRAPAPAPEPELNHEPDPWYDYLKAPALPEESEDAPPLPSGGEERGAASLSPEYASPSEPGALECPQSHDLEKDGLDYTPDRVFTAGQDPDTFPAPARERAPEEDSPEPSLDSSPEEKAERLSPESHPAEKNPAADRVPGVVISPSIEESKEGAILPGRMDYIKQRANPALGRVKIYDTHPDFVKMNAELFKDPERLAGALGLKYKISGSYITTGNVFGDPGKSLVIQINKQRWDDFATGEGGDLVNLIKINKGFTHQHEALKWANDFLGGCVLNTSTANPRPAQSKKKEDFLFLEVTPETMPFDPCKIYPDDLRKLNWTYGPIPYIKVNNNGDIIPAFWYMRRDFIQNGKKRKQNSNFSYGTNLLTGVTGWHNIGPESGKERPLLGLIDLIENPEKEAKNALVVEGEKCYLAAKHNREFVSEAFFNGEDSSPFTWSNGAHSTEKTDFTPLCFFENIILFADYDEAGYIAMAKIRRFINDYCDNNLNGAKPLINEIAYPKCEHADLADLIDDYKRLKKPT